MESSPESSHPPAPVSWRVAHVVGAGWLGACPVAALLLVAGGLFADARDVDLPIAAALLVALVGGLLGATVVGLARGALGPSTRSAPPRLGPDHDDAAGTALRERASWLAAAGLTALVPLVLLVVAPHGESRKGALDPTPSSQVTGRAVLAVLLVAATAGLLAAALRTARRAEVRALAALREPGAVVSDDVREVVLGLRPAAAVRAGAAGTVAGLLLVGGVVLAGVLGPTGPAAGAVAAVAVQTVALRGVVPAFRELDDVRELVRSR